MKRSLSRSLQLFIEVAWRRSQLLLMPLVIIVPLGLLLAIFGPRTYVAKSLLLLQESGRDYPFTPDPTALVRMQDRINGLKALISSDLVLYSVMHDIRGAAAPTDSKEIATWITDFSSRLSLELVGIDFLELQLKGSSPKGLGRQLEAVTSRFIEVLLATDDALSAPHVFLERRKAAVTAAERAYARLKAEIAHRLPPSYETDKASLAEYERRLVEKKRELSAADAELATLLRTKEPSATSRPREPRGAGEENAPVAEHAAGGASDGQTTTPSTAAQDAMQLATARQQLLQAEVRRLQVSVNGLRRATSDDAQLQELDAAVRKARDDYQSYAARYNNQPTGKRAPGLLRAPEQIKLIDAPRDPEFPTRSAKLTILASAVAALLVSLGLTLAAELFDPTVRRPEELEELTGVPVLARLP